MSTMSLTAVILAAGEGKKFGSLTKKYPKCFIEIDNSTFIERSINILISLGIEKIIIGTGYLSECFSELLKKISNKVRKK